MRFGVVSGLLYTAAPALASLHVAGSNIRWRRHAMVAGVTEALPDVSVFGGRLHAQLSLTSPPAGNATALVLSLLGGACTIDSGLIVTHPCRLCLLGAPSSLRLSCCDATC